MFKKFLTLSSLALLVACGDGQPFIFTSTEPTTPTDPNEPDEPDPNVIPGALSGDVSAVAYNASTGLLLIDLAALDQSNGDVPLVEYDRNPALDVPGYIAYSYQDDPLDRMFVAIVAESFDGAVEAVVAMDGGQFNTYFGGTYYGRNVDYTSPGGLVSYAGSYAGITNLDADGAQLLPPSGSPNPSLLPDQPAQVTGSVFLNADFGDGAVNGVITDRTWVNLNAADLTDLGASLPDVFLIPSTITPGGTFTGAVEDAGQLNIGTYGGIFGGDGATAVAGSVFLENFLDGIDNENEFGIFVLMQCGLPGDDPVCVDAN